MARRVVASREVRWDPRTEDTSLRGTFASFGAYRWLYVPLATLVLVAFAWFIAGTAGVAS